MSKLVGILLILVLVTSAMEAPGGRSSAQAANGDLPPTHSFTLSPGQAKKVDHDASSLEFAADAVGKDTQLSITPLHQHELPALDQGMTNVTAGPRRGYRFLPHPMRFGSKVKLSLPYNSQLIPPGLTPQDVKTFYFDDQDGAWKQLERVAVDTQANVVTSLTDHFTDMINATVTVPDHPGALSHNPTSMADIKAADPGAGINLVEPPHANNTGDATLAYPIEVPPGRLGMQPQLALNYNSSGGNGWLGLGWDLPTSAITIDTRWGVPRYHEQKETETYLLDGEQLAPLAHRGELRNRVAEKVFHTRIEGEFNKIVRHGSEPTNYWWEVTDKRGTRYFYGREFGEGGPQDNATLADAGKRVFTWALREVRDLDGNGIKYNYERVIHPGVTGGTIPGVQLYLKSINYTQSHGAAGAYTVTFVRDTELPGYDPDKDRRPDIIVDARGGFKMVTAELLRRIDVSFNDELVRQYELTYEERAFRKMLLKSVTQRGADKALFHTHEFEYYDDVRDGSGSYNGFESKAAWNTRDDDVTAGILDHGQASALSGTISDGVDGHLYIGFNPSSPTKQNSFGGKVGFNYTNSDGVLTLIDLNGDNLPDKVFKKGSQIRFRLNQSGPRGGTAFSENDHVLNLPSLSHESLFTMSFGLEAYPGVASIFANYAHTFALGSAYFSDVNGDGLPDLVSNGSVQFNRVDGSGVPTFTQDSSDTGVPVGGGTVDTQGIVQDYESVYQKAVDNFPLQDTLRLWIAPFDGHVKIMGDVRLIQDTSEARKQYQTADGVRVSIQHKGSELRSARVPQNDYAPRTPTDVSSILVKKGDRLYFRVQSIEDGRYDQVAWDPEIVYLGMSAPTDINGLSPYRYRASEDFVLAGRRGMTVQMPLDGTVRLSGDLRKSGVTTDDVTLLVVKNGAQEVVNKGLAWKDKGDIALSEDIKVKKGDTLQLRVRIDSPIDMRQLQWKPNLFYIATDDQSTRIRDDDGNYLIQLRPRYSPTKSGFRRLATWDRVVLEGR